MIAEADALVPRCRCIGRVFFAYRYQPGSIAGACHRRASGKIVGADWLVRRRATPSQGRQNRKDPRRRNVAGAFARKARPRDVMGKAASCRSTMSSPPAPPRPNAPVISGSGEPLGVEILTLAAQ